MTPSALPARTGSDAQRTRDSEVHPPTTSAASPDATPQSAAPEEPTSREPTSVHRTTMRSARMRAVESAAEEWRTELVALGGHSPLSDVALLRDAVLDLSAAHPSGVAQLYAGRTTRLSSLVRESQALGDARRGARTVAARTADLAQRYGMAPTYLAVGVATWTEHDPVAEPDDGEVPPEQHGSVDQDGPGDQDRRAAPGRVVRAPMLLRPVDLHVHASGADVDLVLEPAIEINAVLLRALRAHGTTLDTAGITAGAMTRDGFAPRAALDRLALAGSDVLPDFEMTERILVGPFVHPGQVLVDDLDAMYEELVTHDVVAALAGDDRATESLGVALPEPSAGDRSPQAERGVGDLDAEQQQVIDAVVAGADLFVDAPPGADVPTTVTALMADAAASGRRVLYVPGARRTAQQVIDRVDGLGLSELVLDASAETAWRAEATYRLRTAIAGVEAPPSSPDVRELRAELVGVREELGGYLDALHVHREPWGVSAHTALQSLAELTAQRPGPRTTVTLDGETVRSFVGAERDRARDLLVRAASLGVFELRPRDTPWFGARLDGAQAALDALERTQRLAVQSVPQLREDAARAAHQTGVELATTMQGWLDQLAMLDGVRGALDVFVPQIFERSAADMVVATAGRAWRREHGRPMAARTRRRLRRQAKDLLRPGRPTTDLHAELQRVQEQREIWRHHCPAGGWPRLPEGLSQMQREARGAAADLLALQEVIGAAAGKDDLLTMPLDELAELMVRLSEDTEALRLMPERSALQADLTALGLGDLVVDLQDRRVPAALVPAELDLAWWSSLLKDVLRSDAALAGYDGPALAALAERFRRLDLAQTETLTAPVRRAAARRLRTSLDEHRQEVAQLTRELDVPGDVRQTVARHPHLVGVLRPVWVVPPVLVPQLLPPGDRVDLLILDGVHHLPVAQAVGALARAGQVVLVGDSRRGGEGLLGVLAPLLPRLELPTDRAQREESVAAFLAVHGYEDAITPVPVPPGPARVRLELVAGSGMAAPGADAVESVEAEVARVVDLVVEHALSRPEHSLAVIALNARHADRLREAVLAAVADSPAVAGFFDAAAPEPFVVTDPSGAGGLRRDAILLSVGFAKTPHGRVLHNFGTISGPDGAACLVDALEAVRHRLVVVSCIAPGEIDRSRSHHHGPQLLADLIDFAANEGVVDQADEPSAPGALLLDLAERLWLLGLTVVPEYGVPGGLRVPLGIGHPDLPGELLLAVVTDDADYVAEPSLRRRERHWVQRLVDRGWRVHTAFSTALFLDPQREAEQILTTVLEVVSDTQYERRSNHAPVPVIPASLPDENGAGPATPVAGVGEPAAGEQPGAAHGAASGARGPRPELTVGLAITAYDDGQLDALARWLAADGKERSSEELADALRTELGARRGAQEDAALRRVADRHA